MSRKKIRKAKVKGLDIEDSVTEKMIPEEFEPDVYGEDRKAFVVELAPYPVTSNNSAELQDWIHNHLDKCSYHDCIFMPRHTIRSLDELETSRRMHGNKDVE